MGSNPFSRTNFQCGNSPIGRGNGLKIHSVRVRLPLPVPNNAVVAQLAEAIVSEAIQCEFESRRRYQFSIAGGRLDLARAHNPGLKSVRIRHSATFESPLRLEL